MKKELEELLECILKTDCNDNDLDVQFKDIKDKAKVALDNDFIQEVKETFDYAINYQYNSFVETPTRTGFIKSFYGYSGELPFIDNHFDRLDIIISTVCSESKKAKAKKKEEEKNDIKEKSK